jgi:hypothetical protein
MTGTQVAASPVRESQKLPPPLNGFPNAAPKVTVPTVQAETSTQTMEDEAVHWEQLASQVDTASGQQGATPRLQRAKPAPGKKVDVSSVSEIARLKRKYRLAIILGGALLAGIIISLIVTLVSWLSRDKKKDDKSTESDHKTLLVSKDGPYKTLGQALNDARPGDHIKVQNSIEEYCELNGPRYKQITIEAANSSVVWKLPENSPKKRVAYLSNIDGLVIRGFTLDGQVSQGPVDDIFVLSGNCPGLVLEDLHFRNFKSSGVRIINCAGAPSKPLTLIALDIGPGGLPPPDKPESPIRLQIQTSIVDPKTNQHILIRNCHAKGEFTQTTIAKLAPPNPDDDIRVESSDTIFALK